MLTFFIDDILNIWIHPLQEMDDGILLVWLYSGQLVEPELKLSPGVLKYPTVLQHLLGEIW